MADEIKVILNCSCGGDLETKEDAPTEASDVFCKACGQRVGTYGEVTSAGLEYAMAQMTEFVEREFDKVKRAFEQPIMLKL
jgi:hypothetical protein